MPINSDQNKRLQVILSNEEYELFKAYAEATSWGGPRQRSMSEIARDWLMVQLWRQTECCLVADQHVKQTMDPDPRQGKACWGFKCNYCKIQEGCMAGTDARTYLPTDEAIEHMKPAAKAEAQTLKGDEYLRVSPKVLDPHRGCN